MQKLKKFLSTINYQQSTIPGFTLIELLVVISIIGILASLTMVSYSAAQKQARDTERRSDLAQYRNGLENFATGNNSLYPRYTSRQSAVAVPCGTVLRPNFMSTCPPDPGTYTYRYRSNSDVAGANDGQPGATQYVLWVQLETGGFWEVCSDGRSGKLGFTLESQISDTNGNCQLP